MTARRRRSLDEVLAQTAPTDPQPIDQAPPASVATAWRKFTMRNDDEDDERAHRVTDDVVRRAGVRPTKGMRADVVRALFAEAQDDPALRARLAARLRGTTTP